MAALLTEHTEYTISLAKAEVPLIEYWPFLKSVFFQHLYAVNNVYTVEGHPRRYIPCSSMAYYYKL
jgi:hypothetical protein